MSRLELAIGQIESARQYTLHLLGDIGEAEWFRQPKEGVTHIAWQVAHLAMAEYRLCLDRIRGTRPEDTQLISAEFLAKFGRESVPIADAANNPTPAQIRQVLDRVHAQVMREVGQLTDADLDAAALKSHPLFSTKLGALLWCARHEMLHAGQIGLLRRLLGHSPLW